MDIPITTDLDLILMKTTDSTSYQRVPLVPEAILEKEKKKKDGTPFIIITAVCPQYSI